MNVSFLNDTDKYILKKDSEIIITNIIRSFDINPINDINNLQIFIKLRDLHKMIKNNDKIIINDNKGSLTVHNIIEIIRGIKKSNTYSDIRLKDDLINPILRKVSSNVNTLLVDDNFDTYLDHPYDPNLDLEDHYCIYKEPDINISKIILDEFDLQRKKHKLFKSSF